MTILSVGRVRPPWITLAAGCVGLLGAAAAGAVDFHNDSGTMTGSWDTTLSYGQGWRLLPRDCRLIATADGGCGYGPNSDDGDLNFGRGTFSQAFKMDSELSVNYLNRLGAFVRVSALLDQYVEQEGTARTALTAQAQRLVGDYTRLLDAFGYWRFDLGSMPAELRLGRQVVNWGESTFIQGGISEINHYDVSALREPGSELKEAYLPEQMAVFNLQLSNHWSAQALYIFNWNQTRPEATGSYFSTNDVLATGASQLFLNFGEFSDQGTDFRPLGGPLISNFQAVPRLADHQAPANGQFGFNLKLFLPDFNNGTELGLYFLNYHSRLPLLSMQTGTQAGIGNAFGAITAVGAAAQAIAAGLPFNSAVALASGLAVQRAALVGGNLSATSAQQYATIGANTLLVGGNVTAQATNIATAEYAKTAGYFAEFPKDIKMIGLSFNTQLQSSGIALQGEVSYHHDVPLQTAAVEIVYASLTPFEQQIAALTGTALPTTCLPGAGATLSKCDQLGAFGVNQEIRGYREHDVWQLQSTATKSFANVFRASQLVLVFEAAVTHVPGLEAGYTGGPNGNGLLYDAPGAFVSGNPLVAPFQFNQVQSAVTFPTENSWGYVAAGRLEYPNVIGAWSVLPHFSWSQDVHGTSPGPGGNFIQGRHGLTVGASASLQSRWELDFSYTTFGGAGDLNLLRDRDFTAASIKYSF